MFGVQYGLRGEPEVGGWPVAWLFRHDPVLRSGLYGAGRFARFLNQVAVAGTEASQEEVERALKDMEKRLGRMPDSKQKGQIPIDIDLLFWNGTILKPADWEKEYVQLLFRSVADGCHDDERGDAYSPSTGAHDQFIGDSGTPAL